MGLSTQQIALLIEQHLDVADQAAAKIYPRVRRHIEFDELVAIARAGIVAAAPRFDPSRGPFGAFAWYRAYGAVIDAVRKLATISRKDWAELKALRASAEVLEQKIASQATPMTGSDGQTPSLEQSLRNIQDAIAAIATVHVISLEGPTPKPDQSPNPEQVLAQSQENQQLRRAVASLPDKERALMERYYFDDKTLEEAAAELGLSKSWGSRLHAQAIERLRRILTD